MINLDFLIQFQFVIFPEFYAVRDSEDNEYVFLRTGEDKRKSIKSVTDKTQFEAYENHVRLFGKVGKKHQGEAVKVAHFITKNLIKELTLNFPDKKFHVYLDCDFTDHIIIRFHQHWRDELPYYNITEFSTITEYTVGL